MSKKRQNTFSLVGAGLANGLLAWFLRRRHPESDITIYESNPQMDRARTWSFHFSDTGPLYSDIKELISFQWPDYEVRFPNYRKKFSSGYGCLTPERLEHKLLEAGIRIEFNTPVVSSTTNQVTLQSGETRRSDCVFLSTGFKNLNSNMGYQKFVGQVLSLKQSHGLLHPILMDATVAQIEGYRFFYVLPLSEYDLLIEDTRYSNSPALSIEKYKDEIAKYAAKKGWFPGRIERTESGVLPIPLSEPVIINSSALHLGLAGGFFHPVTGYSLPDSARLADLISSLPQITPETVLQTLSHDQNRNSFRKQFYYFLNRMMFLAAEDENRRKIFEHFYQLPESTVQRFYAGSTTLSDAARILTGRPPVPLIPAFRSIFPRSREVQ